MDRVVLDTNILVAAARSRLGASHRLLSLLPDSRFRPVVSVPLAIEYSEALLRPENLLGRQPAEAEGFVSYLLSISLLQEIHFLWRPALADPDDDMILEVAVAARCSYIITHNVRDFRDAGRFGVSVITPGAFLRQIGERA